MQTLLNVNIGIRDGKYNGQKFIQKENLQLTPDQIKAKLKALQVKVVQLNSSENEKPRYYAGWVLCMDSNLKRCYIVRYRSGLGGQIWAETDEQARAIASMDSDIATVSRYFSEHKGHKDVYRSC